MTVSPRQRAAGLLLTFAMMIASVAVAFAHKPITAPDSAQLAYVLAGGSLADLCGQTGGPHGAEPDCMACHLSGGVDLPPAPVVAEPSQVLVAVVAATLVPQPVPASPLLSDHAPRAPPLA